LGAGARPSKKFRCDAALPTHSPFGRPEVYTEKYVEHRPITGLQSRPRTSLATAAVLRGVAAMEHASQKMFDACDNTLPPMIKARGAMAASATRSTSGLEPEGPDRNGSLKPHRTRQSLPRAKSAPRGPVPNAAYHTVLTRCLSGSVLLPALRFACTLAGVWHRTQNTPIRAHARAHASQCDALHCAAPHWRAHDRYNCWSIHQTLGAHAFHLSRADGQFREVRGYTSHRVS